MASKKGKGIWVTLKDGRRIMINPKNSKTRERLTKQKNNDKIKVVKSGKEYNEKFIEAKATMTKEQPQDAWRVTEDYNDSAYDKMKCFATKGGSVMAIKKNGDIVSVCRNTNDTVRGRELLEEAVKQGGTKLDTYDGNYGFYRKCGFEPVSYTNFVEEYAPYDWNPKRDKREKIVFFKYTGKKVNKSKEEFKKEMKDFYKRNKALEYGDAEKVRDRSIEDGNK